MKCTYCGKRIWFWQLRGVGNKDIHFTCEGKVLDEQSHELDRLIGQLLEENMNRQKRNLISQVSNNMVGRA